MDVIEEMARQYLQEARIWLNEEGKPYTQQRIYRVALKLLVAQLWTCTQQEHELRVETIVLINRQWADFRNRSGEPIEVGPLPGPEPEAMAPPLRLPGAAPPAPTPTHVDRVYPDKGDGAAQALRALDAGAASGRTGYQREARARHQLEREQALYTDLCCEAGLQQATREWAWEERRKRQLALSLLTDLRQGRLTEAMLRNKSHG